MRSRFMMVSLLLMALLPAWAQRRQHDPLSDMETDQLRDVAQEPEKRIKLFVKFVRARMAAIDQIRSDPKFADDRGGKLHDLLEDLSNLVDEMDDNVSTYDKQKADLRKALKDVVELDSEMQLKLRAIKETADADAKASREYNFVLQDAIESVSASGDSARQTLEDETEEFKKLAEQQKAADKAAKEQQKEKQKNCPIRSCQ